MNLQRITIPEIKQHPWFSKNLPIEFMEEELKSEEEDGENESQRVEEIIAIIQEARKPAEQGPKVDGLFMDGSMDLDDLDADTDIDDVETSGDFVCAL